MATLTHRHNDYDKLRVHLGPLERKTATVLETLDKVGGVGLDARRAGVLDVDAIRLHRVDEEGNELLCTKASAAVQVSCSGGQLTHVCLSEAVVKADNRPRLQRLWARAGELQSVSHLNQYKAGQGEVKCTHPNTLEVPAT